MASVSQSRELVAMPEPANEEEEMDATAAAEYKQGRDFVFAARTADLSAVKNMLADGVPVGFRDTANGANGWTALKWAASEGHEEVIELLLEHGAAVEEAKLISLRTDLGETSGGTPLHWAAFKGHVPIVWRLLTAKPKLSSKDLDDELNTPLHLAAAGGHLAVLKTLMSEGCDVNLRNAYGNLPVQLSTSGACVELLKRAEVAAKEGRYFLCACSGEFCTEDASVADAVIDSVSTPNVRPVRYSSSCKAQINGAEDALTLAMKQQDVPKLEAAISAALEIGASLPMIDETRAGLERLRAQIALGDAISTLQSARPLQDRALLRPMNAPLKAARETGVAPAIIAEGDALCKTLTAEVQLFEVVSSCGALWMTDPPEMEEGACTEPPAADAELSKKAEAMIVKLAGAIAEAQQLEVFVEVIDHAEMILAGLTGESELRKALLPPKEGVTEDGTPIFTQHNGQNTYSVLEDLVFRTDFLDTSIEKYAAANHCAPGILNHAYKVQKDLKALLKQAQIEDEERKAKEAAAAAKAAKKKKGK